MPDLVERALRLWSEPVAAGDTALEDFGRVYTDPLGVNGASTPLRELVDRARMIQAALGLRDPRALRRARSGCVRLPALGPPCGSADDAPR